MVGCCCRYCYFYLYRELSGTLINCTAAIYYCISGCITTNDSNLPSVTEVKKKWLYIYTFLSYCVMSFCATFTQISLTFPFFHIQLFTALNDFITQSQRLSFRVKASYSRSTFFFLLKPLRVRSIPIQPSNQRTLEIPLFQAKKDRYIRKWLRLKRKSLVQYPLNQ